MTDRVVIRVDDGSVTDGLADVRWLVLDALRAGARDIVLDVSGLHRLSSAAVACMLTAHRTCRRRGGAVSLRGADERAHDLLHRTGLWRVLRVDDGRAVDMTIS